MLAWTTFAFGGLYPSTLAVPALLCLILALAYRPWSYGGEVIPRLDVMLALIVATIAVQLIPLPRVAIDFLSPAARRAWEQLSLGVPSSLPISIDMYRTARALLLATGSFALFLIARRIFAAGGVRIAARGIATVGMLLSAIALAQDATANGLIYWRWRPEDEGPPPFGPFVNRNHFATWIILALPLCIGYLKAHAEAHHHDAPSHAALRRRLVMFFDGRAIVLASAATLMLVALAVTLSRSGLVGLAAGAITGALLGAGRGEQSRKARWWIGAALLAALALAYAQIQPAMIQGRLSTAGVSAANRVLIWRDTVPILRDFWLTGTGGGTYLTSMLLYQRSSPGWLYNQAHNHYLQVMSEGGVLVGVPVFAALGLYVREGWRRLLADRSGMFWIRAGAFSGLAAVAVQSLFETGLTMPANAALAAITAALVVHDPSPLART